LCDRLVLRPVHDVTNDDRAHLRNRIRHELIPVLCELADRDVVPILARQAAYLGADATLLDELASAIDPTDVRSIANSPAPLARRALREWLRCGYPPDSATVERVMSVAAGEALAAEIGGGRSVRRSHGRLRIEPDGRVRPPRVAGASE
jgi:tRNA(Ile)-lysidine synthase